MPLPRKCASAAPQNAAFGFHRGRVVQAATSGTLRTRAPRFRTISLGSKRPMHVHLRSCTPGAALGLSFLRRALEGFFPSRNVSNTPENHASVEKLSWSCARGALANALELSFAVDSPMGAPWAGSRWVAAAVVVVFVVATWACPASPPGFCRVRSVSCFYLFISDPWAFNLCMRPFP